MTDTTATATPAKKRKPLGPRQVKPIFALVTVRDDEGNELAISKKNVTIKLLRDAAAVLEMVEGGMGNTMAIRVELPEAAKRPTPAA